MNQYKQKSPNRAETGFSNHIHSSTMNNQYSNMILENSICLKFCCDILRKYEELLQKYEINTPFGDSEDQLNSFLALLRFDSSPYCEGTEGEIV